MPAANCITRIEQAMRGASLDSQVRMAEEADRIVKDSIGLSEAEIFEKLERSIVDATIAKKIEGRNKALNSVSRRNVEQFVKTFEGDPVLGFEAMLVGVNDVKFVKLSIRLNLWNFILIFIDFFFYLIILKVTDSQAK